MVPATARRIVVRAGIRAPALALAAVGWAASAACSVTTDTQPRPGNCEPLRITEVVPAPDARGVRLDVVPSLTFSDFPDPDTIDVSTVVLYTGFFYHTGRYLVDLVGRRASFETGLLQAGLGYSLVVRPAIRSLRGCALEDPPPDSQGQALAIYAFRFDTAEMAPEGPPEPVPTPPSYGGLLRVFASGCAGSACHLQAGAAPDDPAACLDAAAGGLSLCGRDAVDDLVGVSSRQVARLVRVVPRDSSRSYLLRKLIGAPPVVGHVGSPNATLSTEALQTIEAWIDAGAAR